MTPLATLKNVTYHYPDREKPGLQNVSLELGPAEFVLVLGPSGSGKSSLLRLLCGLIPHFYGGTFRGQALIAGKSIRDSTTRDLSGQVGLVFQDPESQAVMSSVEREIAFGLENLGIPGTAIGRLVEESLISLGLSHLRRASLALLSGGELQKVALASVLAMQPQLLLLDEPTSQLDPVSSEELLSTLRRLQEDTGSTVVLAEHRAERCLHFATRVLYMDQGTIVCDCRPEDFSAWALKNHPEYLPPVTRLFGNRLSSNLLRPKPANHGALPLTVQAARALLDRDGLSIRPASTILFGSRESTSREHNAQKQETLLEARKLTVGYRYDRPLLQSLDFTLSAGEFVALMGPNGCGKSTLIRHFNGLLRPLGGQILLMGKDTREYSVASAARHCGLLGQNPSDYFIKETVERELDYTLQQLAVKPRERARLLEKTILELRLEPLLECNPRDLSGGERSRVALATVSIGRPPLMVLDEPTRGIDPLSKAELGRLLTGWADSGRCVLLVTHDVEFAARYAQRIILLGDSGILADGPPREVLDGALYFSTQINRLFRCLVPGVLVENDVILAAA